MARRKQPRGGGGRREGETSAQIWRDVPERRSLWFDDRARKRAAATGRVYRLARGIEGVGGPGQIETGGTRQRRQQNAIRIKRRHAETRRHRASDGAGSRNSFSR